MSNNKFNLAIDYKNKNFLNILDFYLFKCPVMFKNKQCVSLIADTFEELGLTGANLRILLNKIKKTVPKDRFISIGPKDNLDEYYKNIQNKFSDPNFEIIILKKHSELCITKTLFYMIRNAFAHGSFEIIGKTYCFKCSKGENLRAIIRLRENTLLRWIDLIHMDISKLKKIA